MAQPLNPQALQQLEGELAQAEKRGDHLEALDILEDIVRRGWAQARHMLAMGNCYMQVRQRQDAKRCYMKAYQLDPDLAGVRQALDKNFAGWQNPQAGGGGAGAGGDDEAPPPPPPSAFGVPKPSSLSMETVAPPRHDPPSSRPDETAHRMAPGAAPVSPVAPPARRAPQPAAGPLPDLDAAFDTQVRGEALPSRSGSPGSLPSFEISEQGVSGANAKVNWRAVLEEASEIGASGGGKK